LTTIGLAGTAQAESSSNPPGNVTFAVLKKPPPVDSEQTSALPGTGLTFGSAVIT
jgi:hypothetical protein